MQITATKKVNDILESRTMEYALGENLAEAVELFGDDVVYKGHIASGKIDLQSYIRRLIIAKKTQVEIQELVNVWKPGVSTRQKRSPLEKAALSLDALSDEQFEELLKKRQAAKKAKK